ncbi:MAG TPA: DUF2267 domain-containing protein [Pseudonocardia sp.]|uniref:DUF2267 domain-containing protein n=1 Tax=Pseudonocardia sp. TaxID=60912 RepID=UPI002B79B009|nr:DUF2267 domain-containing protein [Pseudonocardia sp.]HTF47623.1 DUF2267 domain-containing protein [Pseudonocardia sp.]
MKYEEFITNVAERVGMAPEKTEKVVAAVFRTLGERLSGGEAEDLRAQLPKQLQAHLVSPEENAQGFGIEEFARRVAQRAGVDEAEAGAGAIAVLDTLRDAVSPGEFDDVLAQLGREFAALADARG